MAYALGDGWHYCHAGGRTFLLDLPRNRYVALPDGWEPCFAKLRFGAPLAPDDEGALSALQAAGIILIGTGCEPFSRPPEIPEPRHSLIDERAGFKFGDVLRAVWHIGKARRSLRAEPFQAILRDVASKKSRSIARFGAIERNLVSAVTAYRWVERWLTRHDQCLSRSIAMACSFFSRGAQVDLVIGIKPRPFGAHCWIQAGDLVINDEVETVRAYTPILVI